jgi:Rod binding domain-containing protein
MSSPLGSYNNVNMAAWQMQSQNSQLQQLQQGFSNPGDEDHKKLKKSAQEFESVFIQQMIEQMDKTIDRENSMMGGGSAEEYWRGMLNEQFAKGMANQPGGSGLGLAENIYQQMSTQMSADSGKTAASSPTQLGNPNAATNLSPKLPTIKPLTPDVVNTLLAPKIRKL